MSSIVQSSSLFIASNVSSISGTISGVLSTDAVFALVSSANGSSSPLPTVSDGTAYTGDAVANAGNCVAAIFRLFNASSGSHTVVATATAGTYFQMVLVEVSGLANTLDKTATNTNASSGPVTATTAALSQSNELALSCCSIDVIASGFSTPSGWSAFFIHTGAFPSSGFIYQFPSGTGALTANYGTFTGGATYWADAIATYQSASAAFPPPQRLKRNYFDTIIVR